LHAGASHAECVRSRLIDQDRTTPHELLVRSRREQGLPPDLEDEAVLERVAALLRLGEQRLAEERLGEAAAPADPV
jgi:hypothetical protein